MSKAVQKKDSTELMLDDLEGMEGFGAEFSKDETAIPFVKILQSMSPQCKKAEDEYVEGAEEGDLFHTVLNKSYKKMYFIPCRFQHTLIQWKNREQGGGFVAAYEVNDPAKPRTERQGNKDVCLDDPESYLENTMQYISLVYDEEGNELGPAVLSFKSSGLKYARRFNASLSAKKLRTSAGKEFRAPIFSHLYELTTMPERNDQGSWFSYKIGEGQVIKNPEALKEAMSFSKNLAEEKKVFVEQPDDVAPEQDQTLEI
tara:strand:- start:8027 stop:8800 length:774 start_codon:yes stop_codon:yes gene_type:complete